jgi:ABC-2 type transport system ATP-binding protein
MKHSNEFAVKVSHVSKNFKLPHETISTVKGMFTNKLFRKNRHSVETQHALQDISFEVKKGEFFGIVGRNGSGKSTLLKMLAGVYQPNAGNIVTKGKLVPFIELGVGFNPELTGRENVYLNGALMGFTRKQVDSQYDQIVKFAELEEFMDQKLKNYSSGMQVRLAFSVATTAKADILLIDEVLAVGDADFQRKCFEYFKGLKKANKTVIFVTHDMNAVREYCDRALLIDGSRVQEIGHPEKVSQEYSRLFMNENVDAMESGDDNNKRWGSGQVRFSKVTVTNKQDKLTITTTIKAKKQTDKVIYGLHIFSSDGTELTATNNRMINEPDIVSLTQGDEVQLVWEMLNIFNDGKYVLQLTLVDSTNTVFDWYNEAATFTVKRMERSTTPIIPPIKVTTKMLKVHKED